MNDDDLPPIDDCCGGEFTIDFVQPDCCNDDGQPISVEISELTPDGPITSPGVLFPDGRVFFKPPDVRNEW